MSAVSGRSVARAEANAAALAQRLGHDVHPCGNIEELCASGIEALVIACPPEYHLAALRAAWAARLPVLCEKPLVQEHDIADAAPVVSGFVDDGLLLAENCQWPFVLPELRPLITALPNRPIRRLSLGLATAEPGRTMIQNTLSHLLSLAQAVAFVDGSASVDRVSLDRASLHLLPNVLRCHLRGPRIDLGLELHLNVCCPPPRPAWLALGDVRVDRRIDCDYAFSFVRDGDEVAIADPMERLVRRFSACVRTADQACMAAEGEAVRQRLRLYRDILSRVP